MAVQQGPTPDDTGLAQGQIQRGAQAEATDGLVGTVEQIVVDRNTGELRALVIRSADGRSEFELPAEYVRRFTGDHVYLTLSGEQIADNPRLTRPYDPNQYIPVYEGQMEPGAAANEVAHETGHPIVTDVETDSAQVVAPVSPERMADSEPPVTATGAMLSPERGQPSPRPGVSGEMEGGSPTTSGMGAKSTIPPSPAPPMDTAGTERSAETFNAPEQRATPDSEEARTTPGMYADFTAAPEVVAPFEALPEQGMVPEPDATNAPANPTREQTAGGVLQTPINDAPLTPENAGQLTVPEQQALDESQQLFGYNDIYPQQQPRSAASSLRKPAASTANRQAGPLDDTGPLLGKVQPAPKPGGPLTSGYLAPVPPPTLGGGSGQPVGVTSAVPIAVWLAAAGLAVGAGAGVLIALLRRRARPTISQSAATSASDVAGTVTSALGGATSAAQDALKRLANRAQPAGSDLASSVQDAASQASESVKAAGKTAAASLAAVNWRPPAFRWGLFLGALGGVLFAPRPGRILRDQLAQRINQMLTRAS